MKTTAMVAEALIELRKEGGRINQIQFWSMVERYRADLINQAFAIVGNQADAEDVAQDSLCCAYADLDSLKDPAKIGGWLRSINRCRARDRLRRIKAKREERLATGEVNALCTTDASIGTGNGAHDLDSAEEEALILQAVDNMPDSFRDVLVLHYWEKMTLAEIAEHLNLPPGTVRSRFARADEMLLKKLEQIC